jgi:hypothetical protein
MNSRILLVTIALLASFSSFAENFGSDPDSSWADTPKGRFECRNDASTKYLQRITVGGKLVYQEALGPDGNGGPRLSNGVLSYDPGCPTVIANQRGYAVIVRATQPPQYGVNGYAVIDFNRPDLPVVELGQGQDPRDSKIKNRLAWTETGLALKFVGYLVEEQSGSTTSPPPKMHEVRFNFSNGKAEVLK